MIPALLRNARVFPFFFPILLLGEISPLGAYSTGPPPGRTGAPGELTCRDVCHSSFALNSGPGQLRIEVPSSYQPEQKYRLRVILFQTGQSRWGFQLTARTSTNKQAGSFSPIGPETQVITGSVGGSQFQYIEHTSSGTFPGRSATETNPVIWEVDWTAPAKGSGTVTFYLAGNAANGDGFNSGDYIYTTTVMSTENHPPVATDDTVTTTEDTATDIPVLANDLDPDGDPLSVTLVTQPSFGIATLNPDNTIKYLPFSNFNGTDTFTYALSDGKGGTDVGTVVIVVTSINDPPEAKEDLAKTAEDSAVDIPVLANDTDPEGDTLEIVGITQGTYGLVEIHPGSTVRYTPQPGFLGEDRFTYTISDGKGGESTGIVRVVVVFILGDANLDGEFNPQDLVEMLRLYLGIVTLPPPGSTKQKAIDADGNSLFNGQDLNLFFRHLLGL